MKELWKDALKIEKALIDHRRRAALQDAPSFLAHRVVAGLRDTVIHQGFTVANGTKIRSLVWRFTAVTCIIAVLLGAYGMSMEPQAPLQVAEFMGDDGFSLDLVQDLDVL